jgi:hypothetical protein
MSQRPGQRWAPLSGVAFVVLVVVGFIVAGNSPDTDASNAKIAAYLTKNSNQTRNIVSFFILMVAMLALLGFFASLRARLARAEGESGGAAALTLGAGVASTVFLIVAIGLFIAPVITADDASKFPVDPAIWRFSQDTGYLFWISSAVAGALAAWATAAVTLRTGALPRWFAWFSIVAGIISLAAFLFFPTFVYWLWILVTSIVLTVRPVVSERAVAVPAA